MRLRVSVAAMNRPELKSHPSDQAGIIGQGESELRRTLDDAGIGTWSWDLVAGKISLSKTCAELMGATKLDGEHPEVLQNLIHPDDREMRANAIQHVGGAHCGTLEAGARHQAAGPPLRKRS